MSKAEPLVRLTRAQIREIDRRASEDYHIPGIVLMENAARGVADAASSMLDRIERPQVMIACGGGNNGGDGLAVARHLHNRGVGIEVGLAWSTAPRGDAGLNWLIVQAMMLPTKPLHNGRIEPRSEVDLVIDALFGTGLTRPIEGDLVKLVEAINQAKAPVLAIDVPSGLDADTGRPLGACIRATHTVTFVAQKAGFADPNSERYTGKVTVADIGCPRELIDRVRREFD
jgi:NAD(P)H-hydrate epimerase